MARSKPLRLDQREIKASRALVDFLAVLIAFGVTLKIYAQVGGFPEEPGNFISYPELAILFGAICVVVFWNRGLYRERASVLNLREYQLVIRGIFQAVAIFLATLFLFRLGGYSRFVLILGVLLSMVLIIIARRSASVVVLALEFRGRLGRKVLIYGCGETGRLLMKKLVQSPHRAFRVVGFVDDFAPRGASIVCRLEQSVPADVFEARILGRLHDLPQLVEKFEVDELLVTVPLTDSERHRKILRLARDLSIEIGVIPRLGELRADLMDVEDLSAIPVVRPSSAEQNRLYLVVKRFLDLLIAGVGIVVSAPFWILAIVLIKLDSPGPALFRQRRVGKGGVEFEMWKFRTMSSDVEPYAPSPVGDKDPRITRIGRFLRMGGFDELPQLINVLLGDMSMVGPRPEMPFVVESYSDFERQRLSVKPGITGIWQLSCDRHAEIHENLEYDLYYIRNQSIITDLVILWETLLFTLGVFSKRVARRRVVPRRLTTHSPEALDGVDPIPKATDDGYVVAALDQRVSGTLPDSWFACVPALYALSAHWPVKILVAPDNISAFDTLAETPGDGGLDGARDGGRSEYVPYTSRAELRAVTRGARLVLTDLTHVSEWAQEARKDVLFVEDGRVRWLRGGSNADEIVHDLIPLLPSFPVESIVAR